MVVKTRLGDHVDGMHEGSKLVADINAPSIRITSRIAILQLVNQGRHQRQHQIKNGSDDSVS